MSFLAIQLKNPWEVEAPLSFEDDVIFIRPMDLFQYKWRVVRMIRSIKQILPLVSFVIFFLNGYYVIVSRNCFSRLSFLVVQEVATLYICKKIHFSKK